MPRAELTDKIMPFGDHLEELRRRLFYAIGGIVPIFAISVIFGKTLLGVLLAPAWEALDREKLPVEMLQTGPMEVFFAYFKVSLVMTVVLGSPWIIYQLWRFISPGLYARERRFVHILAPMSGFLAAAGCAFLYYVLLPVTLIFFVRFGMSVAERDPGHAEPPAGLVLPSVPVLDADPPSPKPGQMWVNRDLKQLRIAIALSGPAASPAPTAQENAPDVTDAPVKTDGSMAAEIAEGTTDSPVVVLGTPLVKDALIRQQYRVSEVVSLVLSFALGIAAAFQVPVVVLLLGWMHVVTPAMLGKYRRHAVLICVILGAIITPTGDPVTLALMTVPLIALYELGGILLRLMPPTPPSIIDGEADDHDDTPPDDGPPSPPAPPPPPPPPPVETVHFDEDRPLIAPPREGSEAIVPRDPYSGGSSEVGDEEPESEGDGPSQYETDADDLGAEDPDDAGPR